MKTITVKRPQIATLSMVAFIESVIDDVNMNGLRHGLAINYKGTSTWVKISKYKENDVWHEMQARITEGKTGYIFTFTEESVKMEKDGEE